MREEWIKEIEEKKIRKEQEKKKQMELDMKADEKWRKEVEQSILEEKMEKQKKIEKYTNFQKENENLIENKKRKNSGLNYYDKI